MMLNPVGEIELGSVNWRFIYFRGYRLFIDFSKQPPKNKSVSTFPAAPSKEDPNGWKYRDPITHQEELKTLEHVAFVITS